MPWETDVLGVAVPPNLGILSISMETGDLTATINLMRSAESCSDNVKLDIPSFGTVRARAYYGPDDEVVPYTHGERLFAAAAEPVEFLSTEAGHNDGGFLRTNEWIERVSAFLAEALR